MRLFFFLCAFFSGLTSYSQDSTVAVDSLNGVVARWNFNQASGSTLIDNTGRLFARTRNIPAQPDWVPNTYKPFLANCIRFTRTDAQLFYGDVVLQWGHPKFSTRYMTICAWINPDVSTGFQTVLDQRNSSGSTGVYLGLNSSERLYAECASSNDTSITGTTDLSTSDLWHHIAMTYDGAYLRIYVNGVAEGTPVAKTGYITWSNALPFRIGGSSSVLIPTSSSNGYGGYIDDLRVYRRALSASQLQAVMSEADTPTWKVIRVIN